MDYELIVATRKAKPGKERWQKAYDEGRAMRLEEVIECELQTTLQG